MGYVEGETGCYNETCVTCDVDSTEEGCIKVEEPIDVKEEVSIKVEEAVDIKDEIPEAVTFPSIKTEHEVRLWGVCEVVAAHALGHSLPQRENCKFHLTISCFVLHFLCHIPFEIWLPNLKRRVCLKIVAVNGRTLLKCILTK
jgi:hypothetical protein